MLCPVLPTCQEKVMSENEDVEIARCIRNYVGINCTNAYEVREQDPVFIAEGVHTCLLAPSTLKSASNNTCRLEFHIIYFQCNTFSLEIFCVASCSKNDIYCCIQAIAHSYCTHTPFR